MALHLDEFMIVLASELGDQHHADLHRSPSEDRLWLRCGQTMIHHDLRLSLASPPCLRVCVHPFAALAQPVCSPRQPHRFTPLQPRADLPAVEPAVVAGPAHSNLLPAPAAGKQPMALLLSLFSFGDRARSWPPRAPLDFPEPSPYPQPSLAVGCLVWLATTPSAESCYLSALTLFGGLDRSTGSARFRRKLDRDSASPPLELPPPDPQRVICRCQTSSALRCGS